MGSLGLFLAYALVVLLVIAGAYFVGRLVYVGVGGAVVVRRATRRARKAFREELSTLTTEELRARLLREPYFFTERWRNDEGLRQFLSRVEQRDEIALAAEYTHGKLYQMLVRAEASTGRVGRPEAVDHAWGISTMLDELARRTAGESASR